MRKLNFTFAAHHVNYTSYVPCFNLFHLTNWLRCGETRLQRTMYADSNYQEIGIKPIVFTPSLEKMMVNFNEKVGKGL